MFLIIKHLLFIFDLYIIEPIINIFSYNKVELILSFEIIIIFVGLLISVAYITVAERKILAAFQRRKGPYIVGIWGTLQAFADGLKLLFKELIKPITSNENIFGFSSASVLIFTFLTWFNLSINFIIGLIDSDYGLLLVLLSNSINTYAIIFAGWSSNSRYSTLGALRSAAQMIAYEVHTALTIIHVFLITGSMNLNDIAELSTHFIIFILLLPSLLIFLISILAELSRPPFDLPEAEGELVAGYNIEYPSIFFATFFIGEYLSILSASMLISSLFLSGNIALFPFSLIDFDLAEWWFIIKTLLCMYMIIYLRAGLPRYRYDQLMSLSWKTLLLLSLGYALFLAILILITSKGPF